MIKLIKEKFLVSLVVIVMLGLAVGSVKSLATSPLLPTNTASKNTSNTEGALTNNATQNIGATDEVGATSGNSSNTNSNRSRNNTANTNASNKTNTNSNKSTENTEKSGSKLPYAGTNGTVVFVVVALAASAVYAYKKVSDYNI